MFVLSVKSSKLKKSIGLLLIAVLATLGGIHLVGTFESKPAAKINGIVYKASNEEERLAFFSQFGWQLNEEPCEVKEVIIPEEFDDVYTKYNEIQINQNLDLSKYKGARVKCWTYEILNYPGYENNEGIIHGNILVYDNVVIGGDVSSTELDGFMHGFEKSA